MEEQDHHGYAPLSNDSEADDLSALTSGGLAGAGAPELMQLLQHQAETNRVLQQQQQMNQELLSVLSSIGSSPSRPALVSVPSPAPTVIYAPEDSNDALRLEEFEAPTAEQIKYTPSAAMIDTSSVLPRNGPESPSFERDPRGLPRNSPTVIAEAQPPSRSLHGSASRERVEIEQLVPRDTTDRREQIASPYADFGVVGEPGLLSWLRDQKCEAAYDTLLQTGFTDLDDLVFLAESDQPTRDELLSNLALLVRPKLERAIGRLAASSPESRKPTETVAERVGSSPSPATPQVLLSTMQDSSTTSKSPVTRHAMELAIASPGTVLAPVASIPNIPAPATGQPSAGFKLTKAVEWPRWTKSYDVLQQDLCLDDETKDPSAYLKAIMRTVTQLWSDQPDWQQVVVAFREGLARGTDERTRLDLLEGSVAYKLLERDGNHAACFAEQTKSFMSRYNDPTLVDLRVSIVKSRIKTYLLTPYDYEQDDPDTWKMGVDRLLQDLAIVHPDARRRIDQGDVHSDHFLLAISAFGDEWIREVELRKLGRGQVPGHVPQTFAQLLAEWLEFARVKFRLVLLQHERTQTKKLLDCPASRSRLQRRVKIPQADFFASKGLEPCTVCYGYGHFEKHCPTTAALQQDSSCSEENIQEIIGHIEAGGSGCEQCCGLHYERHHDLIRHSTAAPQPPPSADAAPHGSDEHQTLDMPATAQFHDSQDSEAAQHLQRAERSPDADEIRPSEPSPDQLLLRQPKRGNPS